MLRLILMRHGESTSDLEPRRIEGMADFPLSDRGVEQAAALGRRIAAEYPLDELLCSPLLRARQTAAGITAATGLQARVEERLREKDYGRLGGLTFAEADEQFPGVNWRASRPHDLMPEGDTPVRHFSRVAEFWFELYHGLGPEDRTIGIVAHGGTLSHLYRLALGLPISSPHHFGMGDTCVHEWHVEPGGAVRVRLANCTRHLL